MVDACSKQSGLIIFSSIKYACTSAKYKLALSNEKKQFLTTFYKLKMAAIFCLSHYMELQLFNVMLLCVVYGIKVILHCNCNKFYRYINMIYTFLLGLFNGQVLYVRKYFHHKNTRAYAQVLVCTRSTFGCLNA